MLMYLIVAAVLTVAAIFRFGPRAGGEAEHAKAVEAENQSIKDVADAQDRMLDAGANAPRDRDDSVFRRKPAGDSDPFQPPLRGSVGGAVREQSSTDGTVALQ